MSVRVAAAGALDGSLQSAWTTHITATSAVPPPVVIPVPTGFMAEGGDGSITWSWDAVEGADGYAIQISMDEMFDDMDETDYPMETSHTVEDLGYSESRFARVASTAGEGDDMMMSMWTTHMTGMSNAPAPLPPPSVTFSLPDGQSHFMVADDDDDEATAMAWINPKTVVESDSTAIITPMFVEGANGVHVGASDDNMPFTYVGAEDNWEVLQSAVLDGGATFMVQRTTMGANQEMEPSSDVSYVTCGPFECTEGEDAPTLSIANSTVCSAWDPEVDIQVGKIDNDVIPPEDDTTDANAYATGVDINDGVDLGIVTTSSLKMNVKHVFSGVAGGTNTSTTVEAASGSNKTLAMKTVASIHVDQDGDVTGAGTPAAPYGVNEEAVCEDTANGMGRYDQGSLTDKPKGCFRLRGPGAGRTDNDPGKGADYLSGWTIELSPVDGDVTWGRVDWEDDPFEELTCGDADPIVVADHVDICEMFDAEVDNATGKGWKPTVVFGSEVAGFDATATGANPNAVVMWKATASPGTGDQMFKTIWFDDNLDGTLLKDTKDRPMVDGTPGDDNNNDSPVPGDKFNDLYNHNERASNIDAIWELLTDSNNDLTIAGDLGKVDLVSSKDDRDTADDERTIEVESCPSDTSWAPRDGYSADGTGTTRTVTALDGTGCKTAVQRTDRLAGVARTRSADATAAHPDGNADNYETGGPDATFEEYTTTADNTAANRTVSDAHADFFKCSESDGGDDDDNTLCDAVEWNRDAEVMFADGTFGCSTTRDVSITCTWDADGGMAQGRNALPSEFIAGTNKGFFLKCEAN